MSRGETDGGRLLGATRAPVRHRSIDHKFGVPAFKRDEDVVMSALASAIAGIGDAVRRSYTALVELTNAIGKMNGFDTKPDAKILICREERHESSF